MLVSQTLVTSYARLLPRYTIAINFNQQLSVTTKAKHNRLSNTYKQSWIDNEKEKKKLEGTKRVRNPVNVPTTVNQDIQQLINKTTNTHKIVSIIQQNINNIQHASIFGKAMQKCNKVFPRDWQSVHQIMKTLIQSENTPTLIEFNIFFNSMIHSNTPQLTIEYFDLMIHKYKLIPNVIIFATLLKSFRKQGYVNYAEKIYNIMVNEYGIQPDKFVYSELISVYSVAYQKDKATNIFNDYLNKVNENILPCNAPTFGAYLNVFCRIGDIIEMKNVIQLMELYGLELTEINVSDVMRGYYKAGQYDNCIDMLNQWINKGKVPTMAMILLKCNSLAQKIKFSEESFQVKYGIYDELCRTINENMEYYRLKINAMIALSQLDAAIFLYEYENPMKIVEIFEKLVDDNLIVYWQYNRKLKKNVIELQNFELWQAKFIISYVIAFKLNEVLVGDGYRLWIVIGKRGFDFKNENAMEKRNKLLNCLIEEFATWNPPLKLDREMLDTEGTVVITREELLPYIDNEKNYVRQKLMRSVKV
eukprot:41382_1